MNSKVVLLCYLNRKKAVTAPVEISEGDMKFLFPQVLLFLYFFLMWLHHLK